MTIVEKHKKVKHVYSLSECYKIPYVDCNTTCWLHHSVLDTALAISFCLSDSLSTVFSMSQYVCIWLVISLAYLGSINAWKQIWYWQEKHGFDFYGLRYNWESVRGINWVNIQAESIKMLLIKWCWPNIISWHLSNSKIQ